MKKKLLSLLLGGVLVFSVCSPAGFPGTFAFADELDEESDDSLDDLSDDDGSDSSDDIDVNNLEDEEDDEDEDEDAITSLRITKSSLSMTVGNYLSLPISYAPKEASIEDITFSSSDDSVVEVTADGQIIGISAGVAQIKAMSDSGLEASCSVTVYPLGTSFSKTVASKGKVGLKWRLSSADSGVTGYQIQYGSNKTFSGAGSTLIQNRRTTTTTIRRLKSGRTYYFRIRTYKKIGTKRYYSAWSKAVSVKVKY